MSIRNVLQQQINKHTTHQQIRWRCALLDIGKNKRQRFGWENKYVVGIKLGWRDGLDCFNILFPPWAERLAATNFRSLLSSLWKTGGQSTARASANMSFCSSDVAHSGYSVAILKFVLLCLLKKCREEVCGQVFLREMNTVWKWRMNANRVQTTHHQPCLRRR